MEARGWKRPEDAIDSPGIVGARRRRRGDGRDEPGRRRERAERRVDRAQRAQQRVVSSLSYSSIVDSRGVASKAPAVQRDARADRHGAADG